MCPYPRSRCQSLLRVQNCARRYHVYVQHLVSRFFNFGKVSCVSTLALVKCIDTVVLIVCAVYYCRSGKLSTKKGSLFAWMTLHRY